MENETRKNFDQFVEHQRRALDEAEKAIDALIPPDFKEHARNAVNESVEGFRVLVNVIADNLQEGLKDKPAGDSGSPSASTKVKVEVG